MKLIFTVSICMLFVTGAAFADWSDNFDSYAAGGGIIGQGGWEGWDGNPGADGLVSTAQAQSAPNSFSAIQTTDIVQQFTGVNAGVWSMSASCYIPSGSTGTQYFILLSIYIPSGTNEWCTDIKFNNSTGQVATEEGTGTASIIYDQWVPVEVVFDLDANNQWVYYNDVMFDTFFWSESATLTLGALDIFGNNGTPIFWDDIVLQPSFSLSETTWGQIKASW